MGALVGLGLGLGCALIWASCARPRHGAAEAPPTTVGSLRQRWVAAGHGQLRPETVALLCLASGLLAGAVALAMTGVLPVAVVFAAIASSMPLSVLAGRARRRKRALAEVWPEAIDDLASAVRAGMSLPDAVAGLAARGPATLRPAFASFAVDYQASGRFGDCLDRLKERLADPVGDRVVEGLRIAREVGGGELGRLLRHLSGYLRDDLRIRSELEARQAWAVNGARLSVAAPWVVLAVMSTQRAVIDRYQSWAGACVLAVGGAVCVLAYRLMLRLGRLPVQRRILR